MVAAAYVAFASVSIRLVARSATGGCGCFGDESAPVTNLHVGLNLAAAVLAGLAALWPTDGLPALVADEPAASRVLVGLIAVGVGLGQAAFTALPELLAAPAGRRSDDRPPPRGRDGRRSRSSRCSSSGCCAATPRSCAASTTSASTSTSRGPAGRHPRPVQRVPGGALARARATSCRPGRDLSGVDLADGAVSVRVVGVPHATLIAFLSGTCLTCERFWDAFARAGASSVCSRTSGSSSSRRARARRARRRIADVAPPGIPLVMSSEAWDAYGVPGSPYFVLVDGPSGQARGEGTGIDWPQVRGLLEQVADDDVFASQLEAPAGRQAGGRRRPGAAGRRRADVGRDPAGRSQPLPFAHTQW